MAVNDTDKLDLPFLQIANRTAGPTLQGKSQQYFEVVQVVQHRMVIRHVLR